MMMPSGAEQTKRSARIRKKTSVFDGEEEPPRKEHRRCEKVRCDELKPRCCLQESDTCCRDGYTSRWGHMSLGEHFCNECFEFFYRSHKQGYPKYYSWCQQWDHASQSKPRVRRFFADEVMPYWLKCTVPDCGKWREVRDSAILSVDYIKNFQCSILYENSQVNPCAVEEEACVFDVSKPYWLEFLTELPLLKQSAAGPFLKHFREEGIGLCPINPLLVYEMPKWIELFSDVLNGESCVWPSPDQMGEDEQTCMPLSHMWFPAYLGLRNLIVTVWNMSPFEWLTVEKLSPYVICRGLVRICLLSLASKIIEFLTLKGTINYGFLPAPTKNFLLSNTKETVIVIGGGMAGLSAAKHLSNLGIKTTVLEASGRIGGRAAGDEKTCLMTINGLINNPLTVLCHQAKLDLFEIPPKPIFIKDDGNIISSEMTERMLHQFSGMMHGALEWSRGVNADADWCDTITKHQQDFHQLAAFSEVEDCIFDLMLNITNVDNRTNCKQLTLREFEFPKKLGEDGLVAQGFLSLINLLSKGLDIRLNSIVETVKICDDTVEVKTNNDCFHASRVIVAVPLPVLRGQKILFNPPLPVKKSDAFNLLGDVMLEHVILQFPKRFWKFLLKEGDLKFGITMSKDVAFQYFIDVSNSMQNKQPTLLTFISDFNWHLVKDMNDNEIIDMCFNTLMSVFKKAGICVPKPVFSAVTHWCKNKFYTASGSFVKVGSSYDLYDVVAEPVDGKIFFAGESTFRKIPNSATGAFLSGLREAANIASLICPVIPADFPDIVSSYLEIRK